MEEFMSIEQTTYYYGEKIRFILDNGIYWVFVDDIYKRFGCGDSLKLLKAVSDNNIKIVKDTGSVPIRAINIDGIKECKIFFNTGGEFADDFYTVFTSPKRKLSSVANFVVYNDTNIRYIILDNNIWWYAVDIAKFLVRPGIKYKAESFFRPVTTKNKKKIHNSSGKIWYITTDGAFERVDRYSRDLLFIIWLRKATDDILKREIVDDTTCSINLNKNQKKIKDVNLYSSPFPKIKKLVYNGNDIRTISENGELWICATDIIKIVGCKEAIDLYSKVKNSEKKLFLLDVRPIKMWYVTEKAIKFYCGNNPAFDIFLIWLENITLIENNIDLIPAQKTDITNHKTTESGDILSNNCPIPIISDEQIQNIKNNEIKLADVVIKQPELTVPLSLVVEEFKHAIKIAEIMGYCDDKKISAATLAIKKLYGYDFDILFGYNDYLEKVKALL
jgi:prophage antirepressor-like protein